MPGSSGLTPFDDAMLDARREREDAEYIAELEAAIQTAVRNLHGDMVGLGAANQRMIYVRNALLQALKQEQNDDE